MEGLDLKAEFGNDSLKEKITERYSAETESRGLGCANLQPFFDIKKGDVVLDLGCGNGKQAVKLHEIVGQHGFIYGIDITGEMIEAARRDRSRENILFITGDMHSLPLEDELVNVVLSNCVINHSTDKAGVYGEILRVLKPGGHFLVGDVMSVGELPDHVKNDPANIASCWGGAIPKKDYLNIVENSGFVNVRILGERQYVKNGFLLESVIIKGEKR